MVNVKAAKIKSREKISFLYAIDKKNNVVFIDVTVGKLNADANCFLATTNRFLVAANDFLATVKDFLVAANCFLAVDFLIIQHFYNLLPSVMNLCQTVKDFLATANRLLATVKSFLVTANPFLLAVTNSDH